MFLPELLGDVIHFRIFGQHTILLNSIEAVDDLLEKKSNIYSSRPHVEMIDLYVFCSGYYLSETFMSHNPSEWDGTSARGSSPMDWNGENIGVFSNTHSGQLCHRT